MASATSRNDRPSRTRRYPLAEVLERRALATAQPWSAAIHPAQPAQSAEVDATLLRPDASSPRGAAPRTLMNLVYSNQHGDVEHLDLYLPGGVAPAGGWPVILALPGGGWRWVRRSDLGSTVSTFTRYGYAVAVADYAFAANTPGGRVWPTDFDDVEQAVRWLRGKSARFGLDPNRVAVWGESAGGHLAALLGTDADPSARVQAVIDFYGPTDLTTLYSEAPKTRPYLITFLGGSPAQVPQFYHDASPVSHVATGDPPFLIYQGLSDTAVPPDQSRELATALTAAGVPNQAEFFPGQPHGFRLKVGPTGNLTGQVLTFLDDALNHQGRGVGTIGF